MFNKSSNKNDASLEKFIDKSLATHSAISIEIARQLRLTNSKEKQAQLKKALSLIDRLDFLLESPLKIKTEYPKVQQQLLQLLYH